MTHFMTLASSMKSSSFIAPSFIILIATSILLFHLPATTLWKGGREREREKERREGEGREEGMDVMLSTGRAVVEGAMEELTPNCPLPNSLPSVSSALSISQPSSVSERGKREGEGREKGRGERREGREKGGEREGEETEGRGERREGDTISGTRNEATLIRQLF